MLTTQRKKAILDALARDGQVLAAELSVQFGVSEDTVRRDLRELAGEGLLQRVHGGALPASPAIAPFAQREALEATEKRRIARRAAQMIAPGQVAIVDGGTTSALLVSQLPADLRATIVTHSPSVAVALAAHPSIDVILIGGRLYKHSIVAVGATAMEGIARIHADLYFMGVTGVHPVAGLSTGDFEEAAIKRALAERAAETVVLASQSKLRAASQFVIGDLTLAQTIVVEKETDAALTKPIEAAGVTVVRA
ncbi:MULTISPECIES: DeoR/GlpR family DNA-binding transcription regulator [Burkholderia cepacia complex]|uniref:DeoR family transcriptional regulator n=2 Tax=Burkholderia cepacia complex TaxID=87882 RepID=A0AAD0J4F4_9BURK|nr:MULTISPECIES: DeoR/GlpR family DNA-binding transcription regulator [Burkholderia cepacia complex]EAY62588.1 Transcriptional regulator [Burkholderia cenocepacia PC184]AWG31049.1 DeoR family transcriptional regulator [Burkholderia cenocepacia]MCA8083631.1 DeoR/GlpR family DNA-binding transcription regulator [Burkholderia cenocepacia]MDN7526615.1 DeoR/GlpR family DNA-binding transcription regulator [Burkholderia orbicola]PRE35900.1 DeoR/GlpR transcriptional regulator [Burkholderia cenocepacia]